MGEHIYRRASGRFAGNLVAMVLAAGLTAVAFVVRGLVDEGETGGGKLTYLGNTYEFRVTGLNQPDTDLTSLVSTGQVYNLTDLAHFPGTYGKARVAAVLADDAAGELWLENANGVVIRLDAKGAGQMLSMATGGVRVELD